jgi:hypothetical protein
MRRTTVVPKEENFNFRVGADLKAAFRAATEAADRPAAQVIRDFMRAYVEQRGLPEHGYEPWFRRQVQAAMNDPQPGISHARVMAELDARVNGRIGKAGRRAR